MAVKKILSIDGGGIRGVIPAMVLVEIENHAGKRIGELFHMIAGTSTGAFWPWASGSRPMRAG